MAVRKIPKNYRNVTGISPHRKAISEAAFESTLERDFYDLLEFDTRVARFEVQPIVITWQDHLGKAHKYTPDVLVHFHSHDKRSQLIEIKYREELRLKWKEFKPKFKSALRYARSQNWQFKILTEMEIRTPFLENVRFLLPYLQQKPPLSEQQQLLLSVLGREGGSTPMKLIQTAEADKCVQTSLLAALWYLVAQRTIRADLHTKLTMESELWPA